MNKTLYQNIKTLLENEGLFNVEYTGDSLTELAQVLYKISEEIDEGIN